jgi:hypothetical protein
MELKSPLPVWVNGHNSTSGSVHFTVTHGLNKTRTLATGETTDVVEVFLTAEEAVEFGRTLIAQAECVFREQADDEDDDLLA